MKTKLLIAALAATAVAAPAAQAKVKISGQVNQAAILSSDLDDVEIVDNNTTGSRFRFTAAKKFGGMKAGVRYEIQAQDNTSSGLTDNSNNDSTGADVTGSSIQEVRYSDVYLAGSFGKLSLGKGDGAANGTFESFALLGHFNGGNLARLTVNNAIDGGVKYRGVDGFSRQNRIRYDSPSFGGLKLALSLNNDDKSELAAGYNAKFGGGKLRARIGFTDGDKGSDERTSASIAYKAPFGLGVAFAYGENDAGFDTNWTTLSYQFGKVVAQVSGGSDSNDNDFSVIGVNWKPAKGVEIYLNRASTDNAATATAPATEGDATYLGSRIKF